MIEKYSGICGITESELHANFDEQVKELAEANKMSREECYDKLRRRFDGYHFAYNTEAVYNPFSVLNTLAYKQFNSYWFATGTPSFLLTVMKKTDFDFTDISEPLPATELVNMDSSEYTAIPLLYLFGYLTIKNYDERFNSYTLGIPNDSAREELIKLGINFSTETNSIADWKAVEV